MYELAASEKSVAEIAKCLRDNQVPKPRTKYRKDTGKYVTLHSIYKPYQWLSLSIHPIAIEFI